MTEIDYLNQLREVASAVVFNSPTTYFWLGILSEPLPPTVRRSMTPDTARDYLLYTLRSQLYMDFYCAGSPMLTRELAYSASTASALFIGSLSEANAGTGYLEPDWIIRAVRGDSLLVHKNNLELRAFERDYVAQSEPAPQGSIRLRVPKELLASSPGYYMALGDNGPPEEGGADLLRFYWNVRAEGAALLVHLATSTFNRTTIPFKLKVVNSPERYTRCDAAVLYVRKKDYEAVIEIVCEVYSQISSLFMKRAIPTLTKHLAPGLALAEDPGDGESFGLHRCHLLAEGLLRARDQGAASLDSRLHVMAGHFESEGISLHRPYLNPGSSDIYHLPSVASVPLSPTSAGHSALRDTTVSKSYLETSVAIAERLCRDALWNGERCTWLAAEVQDRHERAGKAELTYKPIGANLYAGTAGIALFLAELWAATRCDDKVRLTALGAVRQSLARAGETSPNVRLGLYTGWTGIALAAARAGLLLGEEELIVRANDLLFRCMSEPHPPGNFDMLSGRAGAVMGALFIPGVGSESISLDMVQTLGNGLLESAELSEAGYSWQAPGRNTVRNLTGLAHGAAGVAVALLELFIATGERNYLAAAELAFQYERYYFDPEKHNWPDFRRDIAVRAHQHRSTLRRGGTPPAFASAWCHGAPGIALTRLRAYKLLGDSQYQAEAVAGLQTTRESITALLDRGAGNYSLCHGLAGNADVLLFGHSVLGAGVEQSADLDIARQVADEGILRYASDNRHWPCGSSAGETPGLMLGLAGIGYFYLRLHNPSTPSVLLFHS